MDYEQFYKDYIPKSCLPSDFGGDLESVEVLHQKHCKEFQRLKPYFDWEEEQASLNVQNMKSLNLNNLSLITKK